jgi:hypothetical protein
MGMRLHKTITALFLFVLLFTAVQQAGAQKTKVDSLPHRPAHWFLGNSWHISISYTASKANDVDFCIGRTYGVKHVSGEVSWIAHTSWGIGVGSTTQYFGEEPLIKAYIDHDVISVFPLMLGVRLEYMVGFEDLGSYLRPAAGVSLGYFDMYYSHAFKIDEGTNYFKDGVTLRARCFIRKKKWKIINEK